MSTAYLIAAARSPQGRLLGQLSPLSAPQLASRTIARVTCDCPTEFIDHVILGNVVSAGIGQAPARQAATLAGLPAAIGAVTVNKVCGSGLYSVILADMSIRAGEYRAVVAGGMESMSQAPHLLRGSRQGIKFGTGTLVDSLDSEGLVCAQLNVEMGTIADSLADKRKIDRREQDAWAARSHQLAIAAQQAGRFADQIVPIEIKTSKQTTICQQDESPRADCTTDSLGRLRPAFDPLGTVTAGNASSLADGAAALLVVNDESLSQMNPPWAFRIVGHVTTAGPHADLFTAPAVAIDELLRRTKRTLHDVDLLEINEAFAVQALACLRDLQVDETKVNVNGGAIALGHPLGASGARILVALIHELVARQQACGIAALCLGGGEAVALMIERVR
jgi:acetyl-CoA C-acetyltransferase